MIRPEDRCNWFGRTFREFSALTLPFAGKPICYCEIGCWLGDSAFWVCENILTHPDACGVGIDPYPDDFKRGSNESIKEQAIERMSAVRPGLWQWMFAKSQDALRVWPGRKIDLLYLDGSHLAHDVFMDWAFAWPHLKLGSLVIFDDYGVSRRKADGILRVDAAVESIEKSFAPFIQREGRFYTQAAYRVVKEPLIGELP